MPLRNQQ